MKKNYFINIDCVEELKKQYFALAKKYHSDINGGSDEEMKEINNQYSELFKKYKNIHRSVKENAETKTYTAKEGTKEEAADFINIIMNLLKLGLHVELCGRWLWITGNTKEHKETLKALGCKWSANKKAWSWHFPEDYSRNHKKAWDFNKIRSTYGSTTFKAEEQLMIGA